MKHASWYRLRGNRSGRRPAYWERPFFCTGCQKQHGPKVDRYDMLDGRLLCNRQYLKVWKEKALGPRKE